MHFFAAFEFGKDAVTLRINADARDFFAEAKHGAHLAQVVGEGFDDFAVHKIEERRALVDQGDFGAERGQERGVLQTDDAGADDDEFARKAFHAGNAIGIHDAFVVEGNFGIARRARAASDENVLAVEHGLFAVALNLRWCADRQIARVP